MYVPEKVIGYIPEKITIFKRKDMEALDVNKKKIGIRAAVAAADNEKDVKGRKRDMLMRQWIGGKMVASKPPEEETRDNAPIKNLRVYDYSNYSQSGGTIFKVVTEDGLSVDLREEILMHIMFREGVGKGGLLKGEFVFGRIGSHTQLVLCGSELHEKLIEATAEKGLKKIKNSELIPGQIYHSRAGLRALFLGNVSVPEAKSQAVYEDMLQNPNPKNPQSIYTNSIYNRIILRYIINEKSVTTPRKRMLWFVLYGMSDDKTPDDMIREAQVQILNPKEDNNYSLYDFFRRFEFRTSHSYIVKEGPSKGTTMGIKEIKMMSGAIAGASDTKHDIAASFRLATMCKYGEKFEPPEKFKHYFEKKDNENEKTGKTKS